MSLTGEPASLTGTSAGAATRVESGGFRAGSVHGGGSGGASEPIDFRNAVEVADAVLYEGRPLYPHSSPRRNGARWPCGVLAPRCWIEARETPRGRADVVGEPVAARQPLAEPSESWWNRTECLVEADLDSRMEVRLRYLQLAGAQAEHWLRAVMPGEATVAFTLGELVGSGIVVTVDGGERLQARFLVSASLPPSPFQLYKVTVRVENAVRLDAGEIGMARDFVLRRSLLSTHVLLGVEHGSFLSMTDPPRWSLQAVRGCRNVRAFPVLAGPWATSTVVLSAPLALYDHPRIDPGPAPLASGWD